MPRLTNCDIAWVDQAAPTRTHFGEKKMRVQATGSSAQKYGYVFFQKPFDFGDTVVTLKLHLFQIGASWGTRVVTVRQLAANFQGGLSRVTWNNDPAVTGPVTAGFNQITQSGVSDGTEWIFDLQPIGQSISNAGSGWWGFRVEIDQNTARDFYTGKSLVFQPYLEYEISAAPEQPTVLIPDGVVSLQKPTVRCDFTDFSGDQTMTAIQVQLDAANNFVSGIDYDSGTVPAAVPELDLSRTDLPGGVWAGLSAAASIFWRSRVRDGTNLWSPWSDPASFTRQNKSTVTITNPASGGSPFVNEFTPPITWTFGGTQTGFRVLIDRISDSALPDYRVGDSGYVAGTATSWQVPPTVLTEDGHSYRVEVRVFDQYDRDATPGDPPYAFATRTFTVNTGATTPVSALTATQIPDTPFLKLAWTRATMPDSYTIKRDGVVVNVDVDPLDLFVSGTSYEYIARNARPNVEHTWKVQANVSGVNSSDVSVLKTTVDVHNIWLWDNDLGLEVEIHGLDTGSWEMPETGETLYPLNSRKGVRITSSLHGWVGGIQGELRHSWGSALYGDDWEERMMQIKSRPGRTIHMVLGARAFRAVLYDIVTWPIDSPDDPRDVAVSFSFLQVDDFTFNARSA